MNWVTPWSGTQNDHYGRHKTAGRHIAVGGRWKFHIHATDQHHLARGAIIEIRWTSSHAIETTWLVAIVESTKTTLTRLLAPTSNLDLTASSSQKSQTWHCYEGNPTKGRIPKRKKTLPGFQRFLEEPQPVNGSGSMTICTTTGLLKTVILDRL
jgi:hypothetical protein